MYLKIASTSIFSLKLYIPKSKRFLPRFLKNFVCKEIDIGNEFLFSIYKRRDFFYFFIF